MTVEPMPPHHAHHRPSAIAPAFLIGAGVLLLLTNFDIVDDSVWMILTDFWPILLVLFGVRLLIGRHWLSSLVNTLLVLSAIALAITIAQDSEQRSVTEVLRAWWQFLSD